MSIDAKYRRITPSQLAEFQQNDQAIVKFFGLDYLDDLPDDEDADWDELITDFPSPMDDATRSLDIMNEWQALHFLLTSEKTFPGQSQIASPLSGAVMGGTTLGVTDVGYGPPRYLTVEETQTVATALSSVSVDNLIASHSAEEFTSLRIYPGRWEPEDYRLLQGKRI